MRVSLKLAQLPRFSELSDDERRGLIAQDARYGHVICRCETVTEGEIVEAVRRGARTVDGVRFRTRAGMGRCQSGFCGPRVALILARELDIPVTEVTRKGERSRVVPFGAKELLRERGEMARQTEASSWWSLGPGPPVWPRRFRPKKAESRVS